MDLLSISVTGYRRFGQTATLKTNGKLVAVLGPNEVGKSSLLKAIQHLGNDDPLKNEEFSRGRDKSHFAISGRYFLSSEDLLDSGLKGARWLIVTKSASGSRTYELQPPAPERDLAPRVRVVTAITKLVKDPEFYEFSNTITDHDLVERISGLLQLLKVSQETLSVEAIANIEALNIWFSNTPSSLKQKGVGNLMNAIGAFITAEREPTPTQSAISNQQTRSSRAKRLLLRRRSEKPFTRIYNRRTLR